MTAATDQVNAGGAGLAALAMAAAMAGPAARAQTPAFPASLDRPSILEWLKRETDVSPQQVVAVSPSAVTVIAPRRDDGPVTEVRLLALALTPESAGRSGVLAWEMPLEVDCSAARVRVGPTIGYATRRPAGPGVALAPAEADWRSPTPGTALESAWQAVCLASFRPPLTPPPPAAPPAGRARAAAAMGTPAVAHADSALRPRQAAPGPVAVRAGGASVQVISSPDPAETARFLDGLRARQRDRLGTLSTRVERAQVRGRTVYRGLVVGFPSPAEAAGYCSRLRAQGRGCVPRRGPST